MAAMRFFLYAIVLFSFIFPLTATAAEIPTVLLFGDSIVAGYGLKKDDALAKKLEASLHRNGVKAKVINGGVSGDTTAAGRNRLTWTLKKHDPDIVLLALGANDMLRGLPPATARSNLDAMLQELTSNPKRRVILSAVVAPDNLGAAYQAEFNQIYPDLAKKYNIALYHFLLQGVYGYADLMLRDGVHPNARGVEVIAEGISQYLRLYYLNATTS